MSGGKFFKWEQRSTKVMLALFTQLPLGLFLSDPNIFYELLHFAEIYQRRWL